MPIQDIIPPNGHLLIRLPETTSSPKSDDRSFYRDALKRVIPDPRPRPEVHEKPPAHDPSVDAAPSRLQPPETNARTNDIPRRAQHPEDDSPSAKGTKGSTIQTRESTNTDHRSEEYGTPEAEKQSEKPQPPAGFGIALAELENDILVTPLESTSADSGVPALPPISFFSTVSAESAQNDSDIRIRPIVDSLPTPAVDAPSFNGESNAANQAGVRPGPQSVGTGNLIGLGINATPFGDTGFLPPDKDANPGSSSEFKSGRSFIVNGVDYGSAAAANQAGVYSGPEVVNVGGGVASPQTKSDSQQIGEGSRVKHLEIGPQTPQADGTRNVTRFDNGTLGDQQPETLQRKIAQTGGRIVVSDNSDQPIQLPVHQRESQGSDVASNIHAGISSQSTDNRLRRLQTDHTVSDGESMIPPPAVNHVNLPFSSPVPNPGGLTAPVDSPTNEPRESVDQELEARESGKPDTTPTDTSRSIPRSEGSSRSVSASQKSVATQPTEFSERVLDAVQQSLQQNRPFRIRLHPPELGSLQVEIRQEGDFFAARLEVENVSAQRALTEHLSELKHALHRNGVSLDRIDVHVNALRSEADSRNHSNSDHNRDSQSRDRETDSGGESRNGYGDSHDDDPPAEVIVSETETNDAMDAQV